MHVAGLQLVNSIASDGSNVGQNTSSLVAPNGSATYTFYGEREGNHLLYSTAATTGGEGEGGSLAQGLFGSVNVEPKNAEWYRSQLTAVDLNYATTGKAADNLYPIINYDAVYPVGHPKAGQDKTQLMDSQDALVRFKIIDTATKTPVGGLKPSAWIDQSDGETMADPKACREKVASYLQGSLRSRPDVDLNTFFVLALNREANISVIDPLLGFGGSKLFTLVMLKSPGEDWVLTSKRDRLFVSLPLVNQIAVIDTTTWKVTGYVDAGFRPMRLALQPDEKYLWVANDAEGAQAGGVTLIDTATLKPAASISTGAGHHELAFGEDSRFGFVTNQQSGTLSVVESAKLAKTQDIKVGASPVSLAFSPLSKSIYVASEIDGAITAVDSRTGQVVANMRAPAGLKSLRLEAKGRYGFVVNSKANRVHVFDASTNRLIHNLKDVRVLMFLSPGIWQKRDFARPVGAGGVYELDINAPESGFYMIFVGSQKLGVGFRDLPYLALQATDAGAATTNATSKPNTEKQQ